MCWSSSESNAQRIIKPKLTEVDWKGIIYKKEWALDFRITQRGASIAYNSGKIKSYYKTNYYQLELGYTKDPREKGQSKNAGGGPTGAFSFGKINSVINIRGGVGVKKYLSEKERRNGLSVGYTVEIGPSIALLKPYHLDLIYVDIIDGRQIRRVVSESFSEENADKFLDRSSISSKSSFFKGFDDLSVRAGIQGKIGAHLATGAFDKYVRAFETGIMFDIFPSKIPILVETEEVSANRIFFALYMNFHIGTRSN